MPATARDIRHMREERAALDTRETDLRTEAQALYAAARKSDGAWSEEQTTKDDEIKDGLSGLKAERERLDFEIQNAEALATSERATVITSVRESADDDPTFGYATPRAFLLDVMKAGQGQAMTPGLSRLRATAGADEQSTFSDPYGGFFVPETLVPGIMSRPAEADLIAAATTTIPMATRTVRMNARTDQDHTSSVSGGLRVYRRAQADTVSSSRQTYEQITLHAVDLMGIAYATDEILAESPVSFAALLQAGFSDEFGGKIMEERFDGTGVGMYMGVNNSPALISITKETGQAADTIVYENLIKARARVWGYGQAIWSANHDCLPQLMLLNQSIGTAGMPVWQPSAREDHPDMLLGRPLVFTEFRKTVGDAGDIGCDNWSQYLEGEYMPIEGVSSIHVRFTQAETAFRFRMANDGAPWWRAAFTPKNGSTLSPHVRLAARA